MKWSTTLAFLTHAWAVAITAFPLLAQVLPGPGAVDGLGSAARFNTPSGVAVDREGNVYVADYENHTIRKINPAGEVTTLAGFAHDVNGDRINDGGYADGKGSAARLCGPTALTIDTAGNLYVADTCNSVIRKVTAAGGVTTLAGMAGQFGSADGSASATRFNAPEGVAVDRFGNVYVADTANHTIRKISPAGDVTTLAGTPGQSGSADGTGSAALFWAPCGLAVDGAGNLYVGDVENNLIRKIAPGGVVTTLAGKAGSYGSADGLGSAARFHWPYGVAVDEVGNLFVTDGLNDTIRKITPAGLVTTLAGEAGSRGSADGLGSAARFRLFVSGPSVFGITYCIWAGLAIDLDGTLYVADGFNHTIRRVAPDTTVTTMAGLAFQPPRITRQPTSSAALLGQTVTFKVSATGTSPLAYQWRLENKNLPGATNSSLVIASATLSDLGSYSVEVSYATPTNAVPSMTYWQNTSSQPAWLKLARWNEMVVFGASECVAKYSNGKSWVEWLAEQLCLSAPDQLTNYAVGGARTDDVRSQIQSYLSAKKPRANTLLAPSLAGATWDLIDHRSVAQVVSNYLSNLSILARSGGRTFILPNFPPLYAAPRLAKDAYLSSLDYTNLNAQIRGGVHQLETEFDLTVHWVDLHALTLDVLADPTAYRLTNATQAAKSNPQCDPDQYFFWDDIHYTTAAHRLFSQAAFGCLELPLVISVSPTSERGVVQLHWQGGQPPFRVQRQNSLPEYWWESEELRFGTNANMNISAPQEFFRILQLGQ